MKLQTVTDRDGEVYEVKTTKSGNIMLCGEWTCLELSPERYAVKLSQHIYEVI